MPSIKELSTLLQSKASSGETTPISKFKDVDCLNNNNYNLMSATYPDLFSVRGAAGSATGGYLHGVLAPNGCIYCIPYLSAATLVLKINPPQYLASTVGAVPFNGDFKWSSGVLAPNGCIYGIPANATTILKIDPTTDTVSTFGSLSSATGKWIGGMLGLDGKIYCIPSNASTILVIDPTNDTTSEFGSLGASTEKYAGCAMGSNGKIYGMPLTSGNILEIDTVNRTHTTYGSGIPANAVFGGVLAPSGDIYLVKKSSSTQYYFNPITKELKSFASIGPHPFISGTVLPNGLLIFGPNGNPFLFVDPINKNTWSGNQGNAGGKGSPVLDLTGRVWLMPYNTSELISMNVGCNYTCEWALSPLINKF